MFHHESDLEETKEWEPSASYPSQTMAASSLQTGQQPLTNPSNLKEVIRRDNKTVYRIAYRNKKKVTGGYSDASATNSTRRIEKQIDVPKEPATEQKLSSYLEESKNTSSTEFPSVYTHDGETYLQQVFDFYLNQGHVIRFKSCYNPRILQILSARLNSYSSLSANNTS